MDGECSLCLGHSRCPSCISEQAWSATLAIKATNANWGADVTLPEVREKQDSGQVLSHAQLIELFGCKEGSAEVVLAASECFIDDLVWLHYGEESFEIVPLTVNYSVITAWFPNEKSCDEYKWPNLLN